MPDSTSTRVGAGLATPAFLASLLLLLALCLPPAAIAVEPCTTLAQEPLPFPGPSSVNPEPSWLGDSGSPSQVSVEGRSYGYSYLVNGQPEAVRGMGYNPMYSGLSPAERRARYERDFSSMAAAGVNTVFGWNPVEFDGLTLDVAAQYGLGVALPYDFDWRLDFRYPSVRDAIAADVLDWVARYRTHPAVRMWAIGNETFHKLVPPAWCPRPPSRDQAGRARALADFYVDLIDRVHALDPNHPVLYREAEDSYVQWLRAPLAAGSPRPWFVYGLNVYTPRLQSVLDTWPDHGLDAAVLVSEFGPGPESRPAGFRDYWAVIRALPQRVIGGAVYVWFTEGPEEVDRVYGLVNPEGQPVDGSLEIISEFYRAEAPVSRRARTIAIDPAGKRKPEPPRRYQELRPRGPRPPVPLFMSF